MHRHLRTGFDKVIDLLAIDVEGNLAIIELKKMLVYLKSKGLGIIITDHNVRDTLSITDRAYIISNGAILDEGVPDKLINDPKVKEVYLGEEFRL